MDMLTIYLIMMLDSINQLMMWFLMPAVCWIIFCGIMLGVTLDQASEDEFNTVKMHLKKHIKWVAPVFFICLIISLFTPTSKQAMMIAGGYYVTNIEDIGDLPANSVKAANKFIEQYLDGVEDDRHN